MTPSALASLRQDYQQRGLRRADLDPDPFRQFTAWLAEAVQQEVLEPNATTLSTVDPEGQPWSRTVLLKACDEQGFTFFTSYLGAKAQQLEGNPRAALTFWWGPLERQVNIAGQVSKTSREMSAAYFRSRPAGSQLGAWASRQSEVVRDRAQLEEQLDAAKAQFEGEEIFVPPTWGGYTLSPVAVEFWQGRTNRLHDRFRYRRDGGAWSIERLSP